MVSTAPPPRPVLTSSPRLSHDAQKPNPPPPPCLRRTPIKPSVVASPRREHPSQRRPNSPKSTISISPALEAFSEQRHLRHYPSNTTYDQRTAGNAITHNAKQIHARFLKLGFASTLENSEKLAAFYAKVMLDESVHKLFDEMPERAVVLYASVIGALARLGLWGNVIDVFVLMVGDGVCPDKFLFPKILKACKEIEDVRLGAAVHGLMIKEEELEMDVFVGNSLIDMYSSCGDLESSKGVFDRMLERDVVSWTALLAGYVDDGLMNDALEIFTSMQENGTEPDLISWNALISGFARNGDVNVALACLEKMKERGHKPAVNTWNGLISGCVQSGWFEDALDAFFQMLPEESPNAITIASTLSACSGLKLRSLGEGLHAYAFKRKFITNVYVSGSVIDMYLKCQMPENAERVFAKTKNKTATIWNEKIAAHASEGRVNEALELIQLMLKDGLKPDVITYNTVLSSFARSGQKEEAFKRFREMNQMGLKPNVVSINTLITGFQQCGLGKEALNLFRCMQLPGGIIGSDGIPVGILNEVYYPNAITLASSLAACADLKFENQGKEIHAYALRNWFDHNVYVSSALVDMYAKCGDIDQATKVFYCSDEKNTVSWNSLMAGYNSTGKPEKALSLFLEMLEEGTSPSSVTLMILLLACSSVAALNLGRGLHGFVVKNISEELPATVQSSLVDMYAKCGSVPEARRVFDCASQKDLVLWNAIISCYSLHGFAAEAIHLFEKMMDCGIKPDHITFSSILSVCNQEGLVDEGRNYFNSLMGVHGITPTLEHFTCMVGIMGSAGLLEEAVDLIRRMPFEPDACLWATLLRLCRLHSNYKIGEMAANKLFEMEPTNTSNYIVLHNIYAMAGMWDAAADIRNTLRAHGLKIAKACSWIHIGNTIHYFKAGDISHPELEKIVEAWEEIAYKMEKSGYIPQDPHVDDGDSNPFSCFHTEKLAICFGIISLHVHIPIRVSKNVRMCIDCHTSAKLISKLYGRDVLVKDGCVYHHFKDGICSCKDKW